MLKTILSNLDEMNQNIAAVQFLIKNSDPSKNGLEKLCGILCGYYKETAQELSETIIGLWLDDEIESEDQDGFSMRLLASKCYGLESAVSQMEKWCDIPTLPFDFVDFTINYPDSEDNMLDEFISFEDAGCMIWERLKQNM